MKTKRAIEITGNQEYKVDLSIQATEVTESEIEYVYKVKILTKCELRYHLILLLQYSFLRCKLDPKAFVLYF